MPKFRIIKTHNYDSFKEDVEELSSKGWILVDSYKSYFEEQPVFVAVFEAESEKAIEI